jgi:hypothetical protein
MTMQTIRKTLPAKMSATARGFTATITSDTIDRDGEILIPQGMDSTVYETNPVLFWNHDYALPVGKCVKLVRRARDIVGEFDFAQKPDGYAGEFFPDFAAALVGQGICNAVSVGLDVQDGGKRAPTAADFAKHGKKSISAIISRWNLREISLAPMQANPEAIITAVRKGAVSASAAKKWFNIDAAPKRYSFAIEIPKPRHRIDIALPSSAASVEPIKDIDAIVKRSVAKLRGSLYE